MKRFLFACIILVFPFLWRCAFAYTTGCTPISGGTCYQSSATYSDISNAVTASSSGDTIRISAGTATFTSAITVSKGLYIIGAGEGSTTININYADGGTFSLDSSDYIELSDMTFTGSFTAWNGTVRIEEDNTRVYNITFNLSADRHAVKVSAFSNVLIDNCTFTGSTRGINVYGSTSYWTTSADFAPGSSTGVYIEDCTFNASNVEVVDLNLGNGYILRHCTIANGGNVAQHGADSGQRSGGWVEIYENNFTNSGSEVSQAINIRGGTQIIYNNTFDTGKYGTAIRLVYYRTCYNINSGSVSYHVDNANRCENGSSNPLDGDENPPNNGWPCKDQIGRGPNQAQYPSYEWGNKWADTSDVDFGVSDPWGCSSPSMTDHIAADRDYYNDTERPSYAAYTYPHPLRGDVGAIQGCTISGGSVQ